MFYFFSNVQTLMCWSIVAFISCTAFTLSGITSTLRKKTIDRSDLFVEPNFDEVKSIAFNLRGERKMLTKEQLDSVRLTGEFEVNYLVNKIHENECMKTRMLLLSNSIDNIDTQSDQI